MNLVTYNHTIFNLDTIDFIEIEPLTIIFHYPGGEKRFAHDEKMIRWLMSISAKMIEGDILSASKKTNGNGKLAEMIIEAMFDMQKSRFYLHTYSDGRKYLFIGDIAGKISELHAEEYPFIAPKRVGKILRDTFSLDILPRRGMGIPVVWDETRMIELALEYGASYE